jgi:hypothetical protein
MVLMNRLTKRGVRLSVLLSTVLMVISLAACSDNNAEPEPEPEDPGADTVKILDPSEVDASKIYIPEELKKINFYKSTSAWYYGRSRQSEHFIVFWAPGYKDKDPNAAEVPEAYRVDIDDLLEKAEQFYAMNIEELKFAETGVNKSKLDQYKMMIFPPIYGTALTGR